MLQPPETNRTTELEGRALEKDPRDMARDYSPAGAYRENFGIMAHTDAEPRDDDDRSAPVLYRASSHRSSKCTDGLTATMDWMEQERSAASPSPRPPRPPSGSAGRSRRRRHLRTPSSLPHYRTKHRSRGLPPSRSSASLRRARDRPPWRLSMPTAGVEPQDRNGLFSFGAPGDVTKVRASLFRQQDGPDQVPTSSTCVACT